MAQKELNITKVFNASPEVVWKAWIDSAEVAKWWGPEGFTTPVIQVDPKVGGKIYLEMQDDAGFIKKGSRYPMSGEFKELSAPSKIIYSANALLNGKPMIESTITVTFEPVETGKTKMNLHVVVTNSTPEAEPSLKGMDAGWTQSIDKLAKYLNK